ncbi:MAG: zf-HC2 domain-containing protein [Planctomycetota bacterium]|nr:zf-HC2 domain-containing protein [Planctomycetota bacterium]
MKHDENFCAEIDSTLPLYVGGDLETKALSEVRLHIADCPRCAERALAARAARRELVAALRMESRPGPDLWAGVRAALSEEGVLRSDVAPRASPVHARTWRRSWGLAAAAAAVVLGFWIGSRWGGTGESAPRHAEAPAIALDSRSLHPRGAEPRIPITPVTEPLSTAEVATDVAVVPASEAGGLRRLNPGERQLHDSAPLILNDRAYLYGAQPAGGAMQPVGLQRVGPNAPRW